MLSNTYTAGFRPLKIWQIICKILVQKRQFPLPKNNYPEIIFFKKKSLAVTVYVKLVCYGTQ